MITEAVNMRHGPLWWSRGFIRIDRQTKWGNPFRIGPAGSREEVIEKFRAWILGQPELMAALPELRGKLLGCWCKPLPCHGDVLAELVDGKGD